MVHAGAVFETAVEQNDALSEAGTEGNGASATDAAVMQAQRAQQEAMLVGQDSLTDSRKRLMEVQEALQHNNTGDESAVREHDDDYERDQLQGDPSTFMHLFDAASVFQ